ncbi:MAG: hypothetical protein OEW15_16495 [Nitrospirota bacterium]|nr:hypothetical protein [Nitrospirota bacterium]
MKTLHRITRTLSGSALAAGLLVLLAASASHGAGTAANTSIANQASASYSLGGIPQITSSNTTTLRVAELISCTVTWLDVAPGVQAAPGDTNRITTFRLTNTGNGTEAFGLAGLSAALGGDQFDPTLGQLYLDANGDGIYSDGTDSLYVPGTNDPALAADGSIRVFVMNSMPAAGLADGDKGNTRLTATSRTGTGAAGTVIAGGGTGGADAVIGAGGGTANAIGTYVISNTALSAVKSVTVIDQYGGSLPIPGATLRYVITVTVNGTGTADGLVFRDALPANTTYIPGSLRLNSAALTDVVDADAGDVNVSAANTVTVNLGSLAAGAPAQAVQFDVMIQ